MASLRKNPFAAFILSLFHLLPISVHSTQSRNQHDPVQQNISLHKTDFHGSKTRITSSHQEDETVDRYRNNSEGMMKTHQKPATSRSKSSRLSSRLQRNVSDISVRRFTRLRSFGQPLTCVCFKAGTTRVRLETAYWTWHVQWFAVLTHESDLREPNTWQQSDTETHIMSEGREIKRNVRVN